MALWCHHVGCEDGEYLQGFCEYESQSNRLLRWVVLPYQERFERIDEAEARWIIRTTLRCYKGAAAVR